MASNNDLEKSLKFVGGIFSALAIGLYFAFYANVASRTKELIPWRQIRAESHWQNCEERLFAKNGLADTNKDGALSFEEKVSAYRIMGYTSNYFRVDGRDPQNFPAPKTSELEKAIEFYQDASLLPKR